MIEPTTSAGRWLLKTKHWQFHAPLRGCVEPCSFATAIIAVEAEARKGMVPLNADLNEWMARAVELAVAARGKQL